MPGAETSHEPPYSRRGDVADKKRILMFLAILVLSVFAALCVLDTLNNLSNIRRLQREAAMDGQSYPDPALAASSNANTPE